MATGEPDLRWSLPTAVDAAVSITLDRWREADGVARMWARDATLWTGRDEARWLAWLDAPSAGRASLEALQEFANQLRMAASPAFDDALLLGMGGSSLGPEVLATVFGSAPGHPRLHVLDSTNPAQIATFASRVDPRRTLFLVASKSGSTLEPNILLAFFLDRARAAIGPGAASQFVAITDPGSKLEAQARQAGFRQVWHGVPEIGGRYSVLSAFGLVPAAVLGVDLDRLSASAVAMADACRRPPAENPGVRLGVVLGEAALAGRDKLTLIASPPLWDVGAWLEQLIAESTGKQGRGIIPVDGEQLAEPQTYGTDRLFAYLRLEGEADPEQDARVLALERAGHAVVRVAIADRAALGGEFFRWEVATAVAGALLGIHPFDQPDVEASKIETRKLTDAIERTGSLPVETPMSTWGTIRLFANAANAAALPERSSLAEVLRSHLGRLRPGDYFALLAYLEMNDRHRDLLQSLRHRVRDRRRVATCLGFGPRFLHSTGQAYKGGPNTGVFLQVTADDLHDLAVPGAGYTFGMVQAAQARGDLEVLNERGRRALRVHLGPDVAAGLETLERAVAEALE